MPLLTPDIERRWKNLPGEPVGDSGDPYTGYDRFGHTERMRWIKPNGEGYDSLVDVQWGYNRASLKTWRKDLLAPAGTGQDQHFGYDGLYQVTERQRGLLNINTTAVGGIPAQAETFSYDETGNWVSYRQSNDGDLDIDESRVNNRSNQMTQVDGSSAGVKYDKNGNMLLVPTGEGLTGPSRKLVWDAWNRLRQVSNENDEVIAEYQYDGSTRRTVKHAEFESRRYWYNDQWRSVEERINGLTTTESQYVWHPVNRWEMLFRDRGGERYYPLKDQLDVVALCDSAGAVQERCDYTAFGTASVLNEDFTPKEGLTLTWDFLFHAEFKDHETGWYNYGYRYYVPTLGRWLSRDPSGESADYNLYRFLDNNAFVKWDSFGLTGNLEVNYSPPDPASIVPSIDRFGDSGTTFFNKQVQCNCSCANPEAGYSAIMSCDVSFEASIHLTWAQAFHYNTSLAGLLGHEQRHILSRITKVSRHVVRELRREQSKFLYLSTCESAAEQYEASYGELLEMYTNRKRDPDHQGDLGANANTPENGIPSTPLPGSPALPTRP